MSMYLSTLSVILTCRWVPYKTVNVPPSANFKDYSGMAFSGERFGIISQVRSQSRTGCKRKLLLSALILVSVLVLEMLHPCPTMPSHQGCFLILCLGKPGLAM